MRLVHGLSFDNLRGDLYGGLTAAVVALPLALAFGVASGAGPVAGLYGAIFVGFFATVFGGTPAQVSGPTGPMTVVMAGVITQFAGAPAKAFTVVMLAGLIQIALGAFRFGRYVAFVPMPVISGFMSGIGCIIIILQLAPLIGHPTPAGGTLKVLAEMPALLLAPHWDALVVGGLALAIVFLMPRRLNRILPAPLVALFAGTLLVYFLLPDVPVLGEIPSGLPELTLPQITLRDLPGIVRWALVLALLGSIDSLLTSLIADNITQSQHESDRELIGQGIGNTLAGLFGAIPGAGATMRTVINVRTGGRTPISGALHALVLLAIVLGLGGLAEHIPHAVLAGILIKVGIDIIDWPYVGRLHRAPRAGVIIMGVVLALTVFIDLITAVAVGVVAASLLLVKRMSELQLANIKAISLDGGDGALAEAERLALERAGGRVILYHLSGPFTFGSAKGMVRRLATVNTYDALVLDMSDVNFMDSSASVAIEDVITQVRSQHKEIYVVGVRPAIAHNMDRLGITRRLPESHWRLSRQQALEQAAALVEAKSASA